MGKCISNIQVGAVFQLKNNNTILDQAQQPYNYLIDSVRQRDAQINKQKEHIANLEADVQ